MSNKRKAVLASAVCALLVICLGMTVIWMMSQKDSGLTYEKQISAAERYYVEEDYENAIIAYKAAIEKDKTQEIPYQRLTSIYSPKAR